MAAQTWIRWLLVVVIGWVWVGASLASAAAPDVPPPVELPPGVQAVVEVLRAHTDDYALRIPSTVDPWTQAAKLTASDRAFES